MESTEQMSARLSRSPARSLRFLPLRAMAGFALGIVAVVLIAVFTYASLMARSRTSDRMNASADAVDTVNALLSSLKDAETGQRGYLLSGETRYLEPFYEAQAQIPETVALAKRLGPDGSDERSQAGILAQAATEKLEELRQTVALRQQGDTDRALAMMLTDRGKVLMDRARAAGEAVKQAEQERLAVRQTEWRTAADQSVIVSLGGAAVLLLLILAAGYMASRNYQAQELESWKRMGQLGFNTQMLGEQSVESIAERGLAYLARYIDAAVGAAYVADDAGGFEPMAGYAVATPEQLVTVKAGIGPVGQAIKDGRVLHVTQLPPDYLRLESGAGGAAVAELLVCPAVIDGRAYGAVELGFFRRVEGAELEFAARVAESLAVALRTAQDRRRLEVLLMTTQQQSEELQTQQEELRVSNEELEEQSSALRASRAQLENQQEELQQSNAQLSRLAQELEHQRDELATSQTVLIEKAAELERVSAYKSEFLANMSHELRTPLNSALILAKLLADNKHGNLTEEQVRFAQTITSAGNDLLAIINDVLDLAKIEAGKVELNPERVNLPSLVDSTTRAFRQVAAEKGLALKVDLAPDLPGAIQTDPLRVGQVLRNLLSNALKFTSEGSVALAVRRGQEDTLEFAVVDTGIGIAAHQLDIIFEAFRQADGSMHRKYGGTGLGLSISRDLARLLGGEIRVSSVAGQGSTFVLQLPLTLPTNKPEAPAVVARAPVADPPAAPRRTRLTPPPIPARAAVEDDRERLGPGRRCVLVIEDDVNFAQILRDVARDMHFDAVLAHTAADGLAAAQLYQPIAILLDMQLPDQSGMGVLDELKRDARTRHIPVHVVSVSDYTHEALSRGAVGYALKPVKREYLTDALRQMEAKALSRLRRVLVVEDNEVQRESIRQLLANDDVEIVAVDSARDALGALAERGFDCMVLDLNLPDMSGYSLLQRMAEQDGMAFPPVIVYTGRSLTRDEEHALGRFSKSIIIKDARSPERLLDEVTLFLHQMESSLPPERQQMLRSARHREAVLEGRRILVVEDDVRNIFAVSSILEPKGIKIEIARNGREALAVLDKAAQEGGAPDLVLMDLMMPEMDGLTAMREIRRRPEWQSLPIIALTAKAMRDDQENCLAAGANDYIAKPLDVEKFVSLVRIWMPR